MGKKRETIVDKSLGGLSLMILLTIIWTVIATFNIKGRDYYILTSLFTFLILMFVYYLLQLNKLKKTLPIIETEANEKSEKLYWIIFIAEGVAILIARNVLTNIGKDDLIIPIFSLIVGLHFFPLAKVFNRKFDYYIGAWTTLTALTGIVLTIKNAWAQGVINSIVCFACAFATTSYGVRMILDAKKILKTNQ